MTKMKMSIMTRMNMDKIKMMRMIKNKMNVMKMIKIKKSMIRIRKRMMRNNGFRFIINNIISIRKIDRMNTSRIIFIIMRISTKFIIIIILTINLILIIIIIFITFDIFYSNYIISHHAYNHQDHH